eukprot:363145-Chlamydomonas_euryale.AAC.3
MKRWTYRAREGMSDEQCTGGAELLCSRGRFENNGLCVAAPHTLVAGSSYQPMHENCHALGANEPSMMAWQMLWASSARWTRDLHGAPRRARCVPYRQPSGASVVQALSCTLALMRPPRRGCTPFRRTASQGSLARACMLPSRQNSLGRGSGLMEALSPELTRRASDEGSKADSESGFGKLRHCREVHKYLPQRAVRHKYPSACKPAVRAAAAPLRISSLPPTSPPSWCSVCFCPPPPHPWRVQLQAHSSRRASRPPSCALRMARARCEGLPWASLARRVSSFPSRASGSTQ